MGKRGPRLDAGAEAEVKRLARLGRSAPEVERELSKRDDYADKLPTTRTIRRIVRANPPEPQPDSGAGLGEIDPSAPWDWREADPDEAGFVLEALGGIIEQSGGRVSTVTRAHAHEILRIRRLVPQLPAMGAWWLSREYLLAKDDAAHLAAALAVARTVQPGTGLTAGQITAHVALHVARWIARPLVAWAGSEEAANVYVAEIGRHASLRSYTHDPSCWIVWFTLEIDQEVPASVIFGPSS